MFEGAMSEGAIAAGALLLAWAIDLRFGEPRDAWHPVAWFGRVCRPVGSRLRRWPARRAFIGGALAWWMAVGSAGAIGWGVQNLLHSAPAWLAVVVMALALKPTFAWRMLRDEVRAVGNALDSGVEAARARLQRLVSRDVAALDEATITETAIETLAENLNDSLIAPLFWYALAGLPGAAAYRAANTLDAMWGYRGEWEWAGKWSARADDVLSWLPARISALLILCARPDRLRRLPRIAGVTPSPNGGWPMGAMALRLGVRLRKPGVYALNADAPSPGRRELAQALSIAGVAAGAAVLLAVAICLINR